LNDSPAGGARKYHRYMGCSVSVMMQDNKLGLKA
jgi:hypothetical protein